MATAPVFSYPVVQWVSVPEILDDMAPVLTLCPTLVPIAFSSFVPDHSVRRWLTSAMPLVAAPWVTEALTIPVSPAVAPVVKKTRKATKATGKTPRKRSPKSIAKTTAAR